MYLDQLRREQFLVTQGWIAITSDVSRFMHRIAAALQPSRRRTPTEFTTHRVPDADKLR